jgi:hypothetical protein
MGAYSGPEIVNEGLIIHLDAANPNGYPGSGTIWYDLSGNNRNGNLINSVQFEKNFLGEMTFDGTDDYITVSYNSANFVNSSYTWEAWVIGVQANSGSYNMPDIGYGSGGWPRMGFKLGKVGQNMAWQSYSSAGAASNFTMIVGPSSTTQWSYIAFTADYTNTECKTYYNGEVANTVTGYPDVVGNNSALGIGRAGNTAPSWNEEFHGSISSVKIYNRALTTTEVRQNFNALKGRYSI